jgi:phage terminase large subunit-like protein
MWARTAIHAFDPTASDARDVMVEGSSGLLATAWSKDETIDGVHMGVPIYEPTPMVTTFSAEEPDRLRGPQHDFMWCDELAAWKNATDAWDMAMLGLRIGRNPQCMISTTPKPIPLIRELLRMDATCAKTVATTYDNVPNLAPSFFDRIIKRVPS